MRKWIFKYDKKYKYIFQVFWEKFHSFHPVVFVFVF